MNALEREALQRAAGRVLDLGAGVGSHALALQARGLDVTAVELLPQAVGVMAERGVRDARQGPWEDLAEADERWDTVLLLMNGPGIAGTLEGLGRMLTALRRVLAPGGRVILDSVNLPEVQWADLDELGHPALPDGRYPGELHYQLEFRGRRGVPFPHLFVDSVTLERIASEAGWSSRVLATEGDLYLAELIPGSPEPLP